MLKNVIGHEEVKKKLLVFTNSIPQILLFNGQKGVGKQFTALNFIDEIYKGKVRIPNHPDIRIYTPEKNVFKLETIHEIQKELSYTPFELDRKFIILNNIDKMNKESSNASLKMFEDIPKYAHFLMTCENIDKVLKTIISRSSIINFSGVSDKDILEAHPLISKTEAAIANGSIGSIEYIMNNNLEEKYKEISDYFLNFKSMSYSEVLDFYVKMKEIDLAILLDLFILTAKNIADYKIKGVFLKELLDFKPKTHLNLNLDNHFKLCLLNIKNNCGEVSDV